MLEVLALAVLIGAATFRICRLVQKDDIFNKPRTKFMAALPAKVVQGVMCPWCFSAWVAGGIFLVVWWLQPVALPLLVWFTAWSTSNVLSYNTKSGPSEQ